MDMSRAPEGLPLLDRGRHHDVHEGACFMEIAGVLAGEPWSDSPECTHPLLAHLARLVNDLTTDDARSRLAPLVPSVIGLRSTDPRWDHEIALLVAARALPVVHEEDRLPLAAGALTCERLLALTDGKPLVDLHPWTLEAFAAAPSAARWAEQYTAGLSPTHGTRHPGREIVDFAVRAVVNAGGMQVDDRLVGLLEAVISRCEHLARRAGAARTGERSSLRV
ncbi:hypothetical protein [Actinotalea sp. K2]|uniref:hypothetical protein n=1 Tax=Actinotalea sp. K2 TaxID=2939438 RepID=UPI002016D813|nr:hypothetical protein [Actinotalea sp. K2]MCL3862872.1 hypothetical protein [Actinotalea sp. K2]